MKKIGIAILALLILFSGMVMADDPMTATRETQGITTVTHVVVYGTFTDSAEGVWVSSTQDLRNNPPLGGEAGGYEPVLEVDPVTGEIIDTGDRTYVGEGQYTMSYNEQTMADNGYIEWDKVVTLDTGNQAANQDNFKATTQFDFVSFEDAFGRATFSESLMLDGASTGSNAGNRMLCPFSTGDNGFIPAYCNIVEMGSSFTGSQVSLNTVARERHVSASADTPVGMDYSVSLSGVGSAAAWINAHIMEGRTGGVLENIANGLGENAGGVTDFGFYNYDTDDAGMMQGVDLVHKEKTTASGIIESFSKSMSYQSGVRRI